MSTSPLPEPSDTSVQMRESFREQTGKFGHQPHSEPSELAATGPRTFDDGSTSFYLGGEEVSMHDFRVAMREAGFTHAAIPLRATVRLPEPGPMLVVATDATDPEAEPVETVLLRADSWELADSLAVLAQAGYRPAGAMRPRDGVMEMRVEASEDWPPEGR